MCRAGCRVGRHTLGRWRAARRCEVGSGVCVTGITSVGRRGCVHDGVGGGV